MKTKALELVSFLRLLSKKWILWIFVTLDIIGIFIDALLPDSTLPIIIYIGVVFVGFLWAGFQVYHDINEQLNKAKEKVNELSLDTYIDTEEQGEPDLSLELIEGNEYSYSLIPEKSTWAMWQKTVGKDVNKNKDGEVPDLPNSRIALHLRIVNIGNTSLDILSIEAIFGYGSEQHIFEFSSSTARDSEGEDLNFPIFLKPRHILICDLSTGITPYTGLNRAQIAARIGDNKLDIITQPVEINVEARNPKGGSMPFQLETNVKVRSLKDIYLDYWGKNKLDDLLKLASSSI